MRRVQLVLLLALIVGAAAFCLGAEHEADLSPHPSLLEEREISVEAAARRRILAELEEVHHLRERLLQDGKTLHATSPHVRNQQDHATKHCIGSLPCHTRRSDLCVSLRICQEWHYTGFSVRDGNDFYIQPNLPSIVQIFAVMHTAVQCHVCMAA